MSRELDHLGVIAHQIIRTKRELEKLCADKDAALVAIHKSGVRQCYVGPIVRTYLIDHGFEPADMRTLAVSDASIRLSFDRVSSRPARADAALPRRE